MLYSKQLFFLFLLLPVHHSFQKVLRTLIQKFKKDLWQQVDGIKYGKNLITNMQLILMILKKLWNENVVLFLVMVTLEKELHLVIGEQSMYMNHLIRLFFCNPLFIQKTYGPSRHLTIIFNLFVFLQIFNFLNARKIDDEINVFESITNSYWFIAIVSLIIVLQFVIISIGNRPLNCSPHVKSTFLKSYNFRD